MFWVYTCANQFPPGAVSTQRVEVEKENMAPAASTLKKRPAAGKMPMGILKKPAKAKAPQKELEKEEPEEGEEEGEEEAKTEDPPLPSSLKLTQKAMKDHNKFLDEAAGLDEKNFLAALSKLKPGEAQKLWKKFEKSRKMEGQEQSYVQALQGGPGSLEKKRKLLFLWIQNDKTCGERWREYIQKVSLVKSEGVKEKWLTTQEALARWGKDELWSRVQAGTIVSRRCPQDKRYWEFKSMQQVGKTETKKEKETKATCSGQMSQATALEYHNMDFGALVEDDWNLQALGDEEAEEDTEKKDLAKALGMKLPKEDNEKNKQKSNEWEEASKISAADTKADILDKVMKFKAELEKDKSQLETKEYEAKKAGLKDSQLYKDCKEVKSKLEAFTFTVSHLVMFGLDSPCLVLLYWAGQPQMLYGLLPFGWPGIFDQAGGIAEEVFSGQIRVWHCDVTGLASLAGCKAFEDSISEGHESWLIG